MTPTDFHPDFPRYLNAKVSIDDRALNKDVWQALARAVRPLHARPLRVLEVGAGVATMAQRLWRWRLHPHLLYTGVDVSPENIDAARSGLQSWARAQGLSILSTQNGLIVQGEGRQMAISLVAADALTFIQQPRQQGAWDVLIGHAFLDLTPVPEVLPALLATLAPGGVYYFTLNFDGETIFEPAIDASFEDRLMRLYHRSMDERKIGGRPSGDSRTGRHLFGHLRQARAEILAAGASDWVVHPSGKAYPHDEAYFLHFIIHTVHQELLGHPQVDAARLEAWVQARHQQIEAGELFYIAHQLDYVGTRGD